MLYLVGACGAFSSSSVEPAGDGGVGTPDGASGDGAADDSAAPDGASLDDGRAPDGAASCDQPKGTSTPCTSCLGTVFLMSGFPFGLVSSGSTLFYLALVSDGGPDPRNGSGVGSVRKRVLPNGADLLLKGDLPAPSHLAVSGGFLYIAQRGFNANGPVVQQMRADCSGATCTPALSTTLPNDPWDMVATSSGVAVLGDGVVTFVRGGTVTTQSLSLGPYRGIAAFGNRVLVGGVSQPDLVLFDDTGKELRRYTLPQRVGAMTVEGVVALAMACDRAAVLRTSEDGTDTDKLSWLDLSSGTFTDPISVERQIFAVRMDATHTYLGKPNGGGVWRYENGNPLASGVPIVSGTDTWRLAIDDDALYYDVHDKEQIVRIAKGN